MNYVVGQLLTTKEGFSMNRPTGVTVLSILYFIFAGLLCIGAIMFFVGGAFIGAMIGSAATAHGAGAAGAGFGALIGGFVGFFLLIGAVLHILCGAGLWKLKEWGRMLTIVLCAIGGVLAFFNIMHSPVTMVFGTIRIGISVLIIWYLSQPHVKAAFAQVQLPPQAYAAR